jgi:hypothetical protein
MMGASGASRQNPRQIQDADPGHDPPDTVISQPQLIEELSPHLIGWRG